MTKTVYSMMIAIAVGVTVVPFPFLPRHLTLVGALTIGIPSFFLALAPNDRRSKIGVRETRAGVRDPRGHHSRSRDVHGLRRSLGSRKGITLEQARTTAAIVLMGVGLVILARLARPLVGWRLTLVLSMLGVFIAVLVIPPLRDFFDLSMPPAIIVFACIGLTSLAAQALTLEERVLAHYGLPGAVPTTRTRTTKPAAEHRCLPRSPRPLLRYDQNVRKLIPPDSLARDDRFNRITTAETVQRPTARHRR